MPAGELRVGYQLIDNPTHEGDNPPTVERSPEVALLVDTVWCAGGDSLDCIGDVGVEDRSADQPGLLEVALDACCVCIPSELRVRLLNAMAVPAMS